MDLPKRVKVMSGISVLLSAVCLFLIVHITVFQKSYVHAVNCFYDAVEEADFILPAGGIVYAVLAAALIIIGVGTFLGIFGRRAELTSVILWTALFIVADIVYTVQLNYLLDHLLDGAVTYILQPIQLLITRASEILLSVSAVLVAAAAEAADSEHSISPKAPKLAVIIYAVYICGAWGVALFSRDVPVILYSVIGFTVSAVICCGAMISSVKKNIGVSGLAVILCVFSVSIIAGIGCNNLQSYNIASSGGSLSLAEFEIVSAICGNWLIFFYIGTAIAATSSSKADKK